MAERGFLPKVLGYRSKYDTPTLGILLSSLGVLFVATLDFVSIVQMLNGENPPDTFYTHFLLKIHLLVLKLICWARTQILSLVYRLSLFIAIYCLAELLEFAAFVWLRIKSPNLHRPYRVPLPTWGLILMVLPANCLLVRGLTD